VNLKDVMTGNVEVVSSDTSLEQAARKMRDLDLGALPVCDGERLSSLSAPASNPLAADSSLLRIDGQEGVSLANCSDLAWYREKDTITCSANRADPGGCP
jgi:CBS domain-containing protein